MTYNFKPFESRITEVKEWLVRELGRVRTGRATPVLLDSVRVDAYGSKMPVKEVAAISTEDARTIRVTPWDMSLAKEIEKSVTGANLGVSVVSDDKGCRVIFPELTAERRGLLQKLVRDKLEEARIAIRKARDDTWGDIQKKEKNGELSEDDKFRAKDQMQKIVDNGNSALDVLVEKKNEEINA